MREIDDILDAMVQPDPSLRMTAAQLLEKLQDVVDVKTPISLLIPPIVLRPTDT